MKNISNIITTLSALFLFIASAFLFKCPKMENGSYMNCHNANMAVAIISCVIIVMGIILFIIKNKMLSVVSACISILAGIVSAIIPGVVITLCMMPEMTCRAVFRPVDIICSLIIVIFSVIRLFSVIKETK